jgi:hypothetical protein
MKKNKFLGWNVLYTLPQVTVQLKLATFKGEGKL